MAFRNALRSDAALAKEYGELKQRLAERYPREREAYLDGKAVFVQQVLKTVGCVP